MNAIVLNQYIIVKDLTINDKTVGFIDIIVSPKLQELPLGWTLGDDKVYHLALRLINGVYYIDKTAHLTADLAKAAADEFTLRATKTLVDYYNDK